MPKRKSVTLDQLARMTQRGFDDLASRMATKTDVERLEGRFERMEKTILADYQRRLRRLEADVAYLKDALAIK